MDTNNLIDAETSKLIGKVANVFVEESLNVENFPYKNYSEKSIALNILTVALAKFIYGYIKEDMMEFVITGVMKQIKDNISKFIEQEK